VSADNDAKARQSPEIDRLIHEPARYSIMALLYVVERAEFLFIQNQIHLTPGNLSTHIAKLEAARYLLVQKEFHGKKPRTFLKLTRFGRKAFESYRSVMKQLLAMPLGDGKNSS